MKNIETVGIREFGNSLSAYLRKVTLGVQVMITDRGKVVAEVHQPGGHQLGAMAANELSPAYSPRGTPSDLSTLPVGVIKLVASGDLIRNGGSNTARTSAKPRNKFPRGEPLVKDMSVVECLNDLRGEK